MNDFKFEAALSANRHFWDEHFKEDRELARLDLAIAKGERVLVESHPSSPVYAEARKQFDHYRKLRVELLKKRFSK